MLRGVYPSKKRKLLSHPNDYKESSLGGKQNGAEEGI
jgi:hypothetical protein